MPSRFRAARRDDRLGLLIVTVAVLAAACAGAGPNAAPDVTIGVTPVATGATAPSATTAPSASSTPNAPGAPTAAAARADAVGLFVAECPFSHRSDADPIVRPHAHAGSASMAHSHDFFGNTTTDGRSTTESLLAGGTTCDLGEDRSSYWAPTLFRDGVAVTAQKFAAYYDTAPGVDPATVASIPAGLAMIAGNDPHGGGPPSPRAGWRCGRNRNDPIASAPPSCPFQSPLTLEVVFPDCWNGVDLDSANHRDHVADTDRGSCPPTHPVPIVRLVLRIRYPVHGDASGLTLSSGPATTAHADFMNAWTTSALAELTDLCVRRRVTCGGV